MTTTTKPTAARRPKAVTPPPPPPPSPAITPRPPRGTLDPRNHTLADGTIYAITFRRRVGGFPGGPAEVEVYSQLKIPRLDRQPETTAAATLNDGRRITAKHHLGSLNFQVATRILIRHLAPALQRDAHDETPRI